MHQHAVAQLVDRLLGTRLIENQIKPGLQPFQTEAAVHQFTNCAHFAMIHHWKKMFVENVLFSLQKSNQIGPPAFSKRRPRFISSPIVVEIESFCCFLICHNWNCSRRVSFPEFGRSVNPIQTRGDRLCPTHYCLPPIQKSYPHSLVVALECLNLILLAPFLKKDTWYILLTLVFGLWAFMPLCHWRNFWGHVKLGRLHKRHWNFSLFI